MMATEDVKLLSLWASPYAMRAILALEAKGVKYELIEEDLTSKTQLLLHSNPVHKKVPVLLHNGKAIPESLIILQYIDETWPEDEGFFPKDPYQRAITRFWSDFIENKIVEAAFSAAKLVGEDKGKEKELKLRELYDNFMTLEEGFAKLNANPFLNGCRIGFADICLAPLAVWLPVLAELMGIRAPTVEEAPRFHKFMAAIREHPAARVALPDQRAVVDYVLTRWPIPFPNRKLAVSTNKSKD